MIDETTYDVYAIMIQMIHHIFRLAREIYNFFFGINIYVRLGVKAYLYVIQQDYNIRVIYNEYGERVELTYIPMLISVVLLHVSSRLAGETGKRKLHGCRCPSVQSIAPEYLLCQLSYVLVDH
jgi:hypothetical protein